VYKCAAILIVIITLTNS